MSKEEDGQIDDDYRVTDPLIGGSAGVTQAYLIRAIEAGGEILSPPSRMTREEAERVRKERLTGKMRWARNDEILLVFLEMVCRSGCMGESVYIDYKNAIPKHFVNKDFESFNMEYLKSAKSRLKNDPARRAEIMHRLCSKFIDVANKLDDEAEEITQNNPK